MSEGNVYVCRWQREEVGFKVWLARRPLLSADGYTVQEALDELSGVVCLATGDGEAVFELDPPTDGSTDKEHFVTLAGNSNWRPPVGFSLDDFDTLYEGGVCRTCCTGVGLRTSVPLPVAMLGTADLLISSLRMPQVTLASERFRQCLSRAEQACIEWVRLDVRCKSRRPFFEIRPAGRAVKTVEDKARSVSGWRCPKCNHACFSVDYGHEYVAKADLAEFRVALVLIENSHRVEPAIPYSRWAQIRGQQGTRNLTSSKVVFVPLARVRRRPVLKTLTNSHSRSIFREFESWSRMEL